MHQKIAALLTLTVLICAGSYALDQDNDPFNQGIQHITAGADHLRQEVGGLIHSTTDIKDQLASERKDRVRAIETLKKEKDKEIAAIRQEKDREIGGLVARLDEERRDRKEVEKRLESLRVTSEARFEQEKRERKEEIDRERDERLRDKSSLMGLLSQTSDSIKTLLSQTKITEESSRAQIEDLTRSIDRITESFTVSLASFHRDLEQEKTSRAISEECARAENEKLRLDLEKKREESKRLTERAERQGK